MTRLCLQILYWVSRIIINIQTPNFYYKYWVQTQSVLEVVAAVDKVDPQDKHRVRLLIGSISCPGLVTALISLLK